MHARIGSNGHIEMNTNAMQFLRSVNTEWIGTVENGGSESTNELFYDPSRTTAGESNSDVKQTRRLLPINRMNQAVLEASAFHCSNDPTRLY